MDYNNFPNLVLFQFTKQDIVDSFHLLIAGTTNSFLNGSKTGDQWWEPWYLKAAKRQPDVVPIYFSALFILLIYLDIISELFSPQHFVLSLVLNKHWVNIK